MTNLKKRIGVDISVRMKLEDGLEWAIANDVSYVDFQIDRVPNALETFTEARCKPIRERCEKHGIHLGLHTLSGVNVAEFSPFFRDTVDRYLQEYMDVLGRLGGEWIVVHAGYHFTADYDLRLKASLERLRHAIAYAEEVGALLLLENMNREPDDAEVHYLGTTIEECQILFSELKSPNLRWAFTSNHAHLLPEGIDGFLDAMDLDLCEEVRLADNLGDKEIHLKPGEGNMDFVSLFQRLELNGFKGHYMNGFGTVDDMLAGRDYFLRLLGET